MWYTKQAFFMYAVTLFGSVGVFTITPYCGVAVYYFYAVFRPQFIFEWALPEEMAWSFYVAVPTIIAALCVLLGVMKAGAPKKNGLPFAGVWSATHTFVLAFGCWIVLTYITAYSRNAAWNVFQEYLKIFIMFMASTILIRTPRQVWILFVIAATSLAYIGYDINFKYFFNNHYLGIFHNGYGGLDNNGAGLMLAMGIPLCYFAWEGMRIEWPWLRWLPWLYLALIPVILHAVLCTYSRGAMVSIIGAVPFIFLYSRKKFFLTGLVLVTVFFIVPVLAGKEIRARFFTMEDTEVDASAQARYASWNAAWQITKDNPVIGVGVRNSPLFTKQYGADMDGRVVHNQFLQISADGGFPSMALYLGCFITAIWANFQTRRKLKGRQNHEARRDSAVASGVSCSLIVFCIGAMFLSLEVFELPYLLLLLSGQLRPLVAETTASDLNLTSSEGQDEQVGFRSSALVGEPEMVSSPSHTL